MRKARNPYNIQRCLPRMSWSPVNLFNLSQRSKSPELRFTKTTKTLFQQQFLSRKLVRGYHADFLQEGRFQKNFLPATLPPIVSHDTLQKGQQQIKRPKVPVGSLMFAKLESRLDVAVFRACLAPSVYNARHLVVHGRVKVDGLKITDPNTALKPGQMFSVDPAAITMLQAQPAPVSTPTESTEDSTEPAATAPPAAAATADARQVLPFTLPDYAAPFLFIPPYLEVNFPTASAVYLRHPTAGPGYSEVPTPYEADGEVVRLAWEWYAKTGKRRMQRPARPGNDYRRRGQSTNHIVS